MYKKTLIQFGTTLAIFLFLFPLVTSAETAAERKIRLETDLSQIEKEIESQKTLLSAKQKESVSLERDVSILDAQIQKSKLQIRARDITINNLSNAIGLKENEIGKLSDKIVAEKESLATLVRKTNQAQSGTFFEVMLSDKTISDFFLDVDNLETVQRDLHKTLGVVADTKSNTEDAKSALEDRKGEEEKLRQLQALEKKSTEQKEAERKKILEDSRGQEKVYKSILASREKDAAAIRAALFELSGSAAIPFGKALEYAQYASSKTGVRPALILGIITEETNLGENVGTGNWKVDMHPTRDQPIFEQICAKLGLNPDLQPVSKKAWYGYGGAMGPAQFIPSTWVLYEDRIVAINGTSPANPWNPRDAFLATALLLQDNGAKYGDFASERLSALRYLAGWKNAGKASYAFYGDDVMGFATKYESQIKILNGK